MLRSELRITKYELFIVCFFFDVTIDTCNECKIFLQFNINLFSQPGMHLECCVQFLN